MSYEVNCPKLLPSSKRSTWNGSDYESNSEYYKQLTDTHDFTVMDNLRLDRLLSPRFHPSTGKSVIYLRKQNHMPDLKGSSITLHWVDVETNKTVQLTRPIWGVNDQQVKDYSKGKIELHQCCFSSIG
jgi:hypothetical protein